MAHLNGTGPEGQGPGTGRKLGKCNILPEDEKVNLLGGMGKRRNSGGGEGQKKRLKSGDKIITIIKKRR